MRRDIVRQDQYGCLAMAHEVAAYREDKIGIGAVHLGQIFLDHVHSDFGTALHQVRTPPRHAAVVKERGHLRAEPDRLRQHGRDHAIGRPLQKVPDKWAANAEAHHHKLVDAQMVHQTELVVCVCIPGPVDLQRPRGLTGIGIAQVRRNAAVLALELPEAVKRVLQARDRRVQTSTSDEQ